jgi:hypothetical protein
LLDGFTGEVIQVGNLILPGGHWNVTVSKAPQEKVVAIEAPIVKGCLTTVWGTATYRLKAIGNGQASDLLNPSRGQSL